MRESTTRGPAESFAGVESSCKAPPGWVGALPLEMEALAAEVLFPSAQSRRLSPRLPSLAGLLQTLS